MARGTPDAGTDAQHEEVIAPPIAATPEQYRKISELVAREKGFSIGGLKKARAQTMRKRVPFMVRLKEVNTMKKNLYNSATDMNAFRQGMSEFEGKRKVILAEMDTATSSEKQTEGKYRTVVKFYGQKTIEALREASMLSELELDEATELEVFPDKEVGQ